MSDMGVNLNGCAVVDNLSSWSIDGPKEFLYNESLPKAQYFGTRGMLLSISKQDNPLEDHVDGSGRC
jgi:hypothetical protein